MPTINRLKCPLRVLLQTEVFLLVVLRSVRPQMAIVAEIREKPITFRNGAIRDPSENVVLFKVCHPSAEIAFPFGLHDAFPHSSMILSVSDFDSGIWISSCSASSTNQSRSNRISSAEYVEEP